MIFTLLAAAHAFSLLDNDWFYQDARVEHPVVLDYTSFPLGFATQEDFEAATREAIRMWNSHPRADFRFRYGGVSTETEGVIPIVYVPASDNSRIGRAYLFNYEGTGDMAFAHIELYGQNSHGPVNWFVQADLDGLPSDQSDLVFALAHELGHVAGLGHTDNDDALMAPNTSPGEGVRDLHLDDEAGLEALYGSAPLALEASIDGQTSTGIAASDEVVFVTVDNVGTKVSVLPRVTVVGGPAFLVNANPSEPDLDLAPGESHVFELPIVVEGCESDRFDVRVQVTDRNGSRTTFDLPVDIECPAIGDALDDAESVGCSSTGSASASWTWFARH
jgi:hypothetical protein